MYKKDIYRNNEPVQVNQNPMQPNYNPQQPLYQEDKPYRDYDHQPYRYDQGYMEPNARNFDPHLHFDSSVPPYDEQWAPHDQTSGYDPHMPYEDGSEPHVRSPSDAPWHRLWLQSTSLWQTQPWTDPTWWTSPYAPTVWPGSTPSYSSLLPLPWTPKTTVLRPIPEAFLYATSHRGATWTLRPLWPLLNLSPSHHQWSLRFLLLQLRQRMTQAWSTSLCSRGLKCLRTSDLCL